MNSLEGKIALVTGASGGIGRAIAIKFSELGAQVAVHYAGGKARAEETESFLTGENHVCTQADLSDPDSVEKLVAQVVENFGRLDILVNNAGVFDLHQIEHLDFAGWQEAWQHTISVNLIGPANLCFCAIRQMQKQGGGKIVNISSRGAFRGEPDAPAYGASKAGLNALTQSLAKKMAPENIFLYAIAPGFVETDRVAPILKGPFGKEVRNQSPLGRVARPEEVAHTAAFLAANGSEFLTGAIVDVNGASYLRS